jgi:hypothetical protein
LLIVPYTPGRYPGLWYFALSGLELPPFQLELVPFQGSISRPIFADVPGKTARHCGGEFAFSWSP